MAQANYWLVVQQGPEPGRKIDLADGEIVIGRDPSANIVFDSTAVSRQHARLRVDDRSVWLEDLGSSNGTYLNGEKIQSRTALKNGDQVSLGRSVVLELGCIPQPGGMATAVLNKATVIETGTNGAAAGLRKTILGEAPEIAEQPAQLEVTIAGGKPVLFTLNKETITIGRLEGNDIAIPSPIVSRELAILRQTNPGYSLEMLPQVTNPILLEGRPLSGSHLLRHGEQMRIGGQDPGVMVTLRFLNPSEEARPPKKMVNFAGKERITIGRDPENDVVLASPRVSRYHAQIERVGQRYRVTDLRSANGTFVNDQRIEGTTWLQPSDTIRIGTNRFVVGDTGLSRVDDSGGLRVEAVGLNKWVRKDLNLLKDISLVFQPREFVVIVGQSGGGKSTLVDAIAGYRPASQGKVLVNGIDAYRNFDAVRNDIGYVPQKDIIHMELTVYQALHYAAQLRMPADTTPAERHQRIMQVLEDLDLTHRKDVQISGLSGGQQKRVSIGVELLTQPGLFFLDEPTSGLDPGTETALMHLMRRLADQGRTIMLITHATKNVMLADKVVFLARGGYLAWYGPPDEALAYFDQYRSERDRRARPIEFDEIYAILDDPSRGKAADWAKRYQEHPAYQKYITQPLDALGHSLPAADGQAKSFSRPSAAPQPAAQRIKTARQTSGSKVSGLRQFFILSARNARILIRDRPSLVLMLAVAPILSMLDVILSFVLGRDLFSFQNGNVASVVTSLFMPIMYSVMVGALAQMREFVKESEIYKRERLVNLKVLPYVLSKVWVAALLGLYQAFVYTAVHYLAFKMPGGVTEFLAIYATLYLATLAGMMLGLASSALAPNANAVPLIVILFLVPQFVLGGAMIPVPSYISAPTSARWAFEALLAITGPGSDVARDSCWALPESVRDDMSLEDKLARGCTCMGIAALKEGSCDFPGIGKSYDPVIDQAEPVEPPDIGKAPADPVLPEAPAKPAENANQQEMGAYLQSLNDYQAQVDKIQADYKGQVKAYQDKADAYKVQSSDYEKALTEWKIKRNSAVGEAEGIIKAVYNDFNWTFVDKKDTKAYWEKITGTWASQGVIILVLTVASILLIWRKDRLA
jgi:ABC-type multidrug transport system ATPase subunit